MNPDTIHISKYLFTIGRERIKLCKYCNTIIREGVDVKYRQYNYCSEWCKENDNPPDISHTCKLCGVVVYSPQRKDGRKSGMYPSYCKKCIKIKGKNRLSKHF